MADRVSIGEALQLLEGVVEWEELGLHLGLSDAVIKEVRCTVGDVSIKRMVMMSKWLQSDLDTTWSKLAKALLKMNPPYKVLAAKIRQQRGLSPETRQDPGEDKCKLVKLGMTYPRPRPFDKGEEKGRCPSKIDSPILWYPRTK